MVTLDEERGLIVEEGTPGDKETREKTRDQNKLQENARPEKKSAPEIKEQEQEGRASMQLSQLLTSSATRTLATENNWLKSVISILKADNNALKCEIVECMRSKDTACGDNPKDENSNGSGEGGNEEVTQADSDGELDIHDDYKPEVVDSDQKKPAGLQS
ncbi:hypothetical protein CC78DRAFT_583441 [Lojkania enalia]|uniref:Uncharacterized protein n=1 Tax=Lojkania enalia TaxID=147567 RepID=A0A9P4K4C0_9PLEO|nr:hypothetical protein CC78DRAFT_583441 [Didymosphaeria enalia]